MCSPGPLVRVTSHFLGRLSHFRQWSASHNAKRQPVRLPFRLVDYTGKISNFFDDLEKLDRFAESIEDELHNLIIEKAESWDYPCNNREKSRKYRLWLELLWCECGFNSLHVLTRIVVRFASFVYFCRKLNELWYRTTSGNIPIGPSSVGIPTE